MTNSAGSSDGVPAPDGALPGYPSMPAPPSLPLPAPPAPPPRVLPPPSGPAFGTSPPPPPIGGAAFGQPSSFGQQPASATSEPGSGRSRNIVLVLVAAVAVIGLAVFAFVGSGDPDQTAQSDERTTSDSGPSNDVADEPDDDVVEQEPPEERRAFSIDPFRPDSVAVDATSVWVSDSACGVVLQIDKATEEIVGAVSVGASASGVAVAGSFVWVGTRDEGQVVRIDPTRLQVVGSVPVPGSALGLTAVGDQLWATDPLIGAVYRIDAARSQLVETVRVGTDPHHVAIGDSAVWVTNQLDDTVTRIGNSGRGTNALPVGSRPLHVELGAGSAWVTDSGDGAVRRLDEATGEVQAVIPVGVWPHALAFANGMVWVGTETGSFWRIDPSSNEATRVEDADFASIDTTVDGNNVWVADSSGGLVVRFDAGTGSVGSIIDVNEFGDCATFQDEADGPQRDTDL